MKVPLRSEEQCRQYSDCLRVGRAGVRASMEKKDFIFPISSKPALWLVRPSLLLVPRLFSRVMTAGGRHWPTPHLSPGLLSSDRAMPLLSFCVPTGRRPVHLHCLVQVALCWWSRVCNVPEYRALVSRRPQSQFTQNSYDSSVFLCKVTVRRITQQLLSPYRRQFLQGVQ